jgi:hypothetical protein
MDEEAFRRFLRRAGTKEHVIDGLVSQVKAYEAYLSAPGLAGLEAAAPQDLQAYVDSLDPAAVKARVRGVALYYRYMGNEPLARLASEIRERRIATIRRAFPLREFRGVNAAEIARLEAQGIATADQMLEAGKTPGLRQELAARTGVSHQGILELVKLSDLSRLGSIKGVRARLYYDAGLDTPEVFRRWEPDALRAMLAEWVERTGFDGIAPLPREIRNTIATARSLPGIIEYDA